MTRSLSRRDFLNGVALSLAAGTTLTPLEILARTTKSGTAYYPPGLTGMRGSHDGSFEVAHAVAREGKRFARPATRTGPVYDLVVVGGGISGLAAAKFFRDRNGGGKILVLDNHDDFGGHARRNEFDVDGKTLLGYGGSQTIEGPARYSGVAKQLLRDLAIETDRFYEYFDQDYFPSRGLGSGIFFDHATYGVNRVTPNLIGSFFDEPLTGSAATAAARAMPIDRADQDALLDLLASEVDYLAGRSRQEKVDLLRSISYLEFLERHAGVPESVRGILQDRLLPLFSVGWEAASAYDAASYWQPGTWYLGVQPEEDDDEPYIHHFPDGNASIARALVRDLVPGAMPGSTMEDLVTARADYARLDTADTDVRIRLESTAVNVANTPDGKHVDITYVHNGEPFRVRARHAVLACYNNIIPHLCDELPQQQVEAIRYATKVPFVISSIALYDWRAFAEAGYSSFYSPGDVCFKTLFLDFPVSMGAYEYARNPDDPIVVSGWYSPTTRGLPAKDQYRAGRARLLQMSYDDFETDIVAHLDAMLGPHGFDARRDIAAITLNRWPHGYAYEFEQIGEPAAYNRYNGPHIAGRAQVGRISIANSDSEAYAYVNGAIDAADRAVNEQLA